MITMTDAARAWHKGNDAGEGFAPVGATVDEAVDVLLKEDGASLWSPREADDQIAVVERADGRLVGIGDAHGAWAVLL